MVEGKEGLTGADSTSLKTATTSTLADMWLRPEPVGCEVFCVDNVDAITSVFDRIRHSLRLCAKS